MNGARRSAFLIGLPEAGKTTFLAALFHVVESSEISSALKLERLHGDHKHLNDIRGLWADAKPLERTKIPDEQTVSMLVRHTQSGLVAEVVLPDLSGESFELQWTDRRMSADFAELVKQSVGGLLLIHPAKVREEVLISEVDGIVQQLTPSTTAVEQGQSGKESLSTDIAATTEPTVEWSPDNAPTAAKLVELLQFIARVARYAPYCLP